MDILLDDIAVVGRESPLRYTLRKQKPAMNFPYWITGQGCACLDSQRSLLATCQKYNALINCVVVCQTFFV